MKETLPSRIGNPLKALRKAKLDNITLVPTSLLSQKGKYQTIANNLPGRGILICQAEKKERITTILERGAVFFRQRGHFVRTLPYSLLLSVSEHRPTFPKVRESSSQFHS